MPEIVGNLHLHTIASDGTGTHDEVASAAARAGLDFLIYTDHNVWVDGLDGWYRDPATNREILRLMGQEINDEFIPVALRFFKPEGVAGCLPHSIGLAFKGANSFRRKWVGGIQFKECGPGIPEIIHLNACLWM